MIKNPAERMARLQGHVAMGWQMVVSDSDGRPILDALRKAETKELVYLV